MSARKSAFITEIEFGQVFELLIRLRARHGRGGGVSTILFRGDFEHRERHGLAARGVWRSRGGGRRWIHGTGGGGLRRDERCEPPADDHRGEDAKMGVHRANALLARSGLKSNSKRAASRC